MKQMKKGNYRAFEKFVEHYHQSVYQICYLIIGDCKDAEVIAKDIFLDVYYHIDDWQATDREFSLQLFQHTVTFARARYGERKHCGRFVYSNLNKKNKNDILFIIMNISLKERLALILNFTNQLSVQEISEILDIPHSETKTYIWQGREAIRELISS